MKYLLRFLRRMPWANAFGEPGRWIEIGEVLESECDVQIWPFGGLKPEVDVKSLPHPANDGEPTTAAEVLAALDALDAWIANGYVTNRRLVLSVAGSSADQVASLPKIVRERVGCVITCAIEHCRMPDKPDVGWTLTDAILAMNKVRKWATDVGGKAEPPTAPAEPPTAPAKFDRRDWISASEAVGKLVSKIPSLKALKAFAKKNPEKLRLMKDPEHAQRLLAHVGDVTKLEKAIGDKVWDALDRPEAEGRPSIADGDGSESEFAAMKARMAKMRAKKQQGK